MKVRWKFNHWIPKRLGVAAITLYPWILVAEREAPARLMAHELEHVKQIQLFGPVRFYLAYVIEYLAHRIRYGNHFDAYWFISFEIEARAAERREILVQNLRHH